MKINQLQKVRKNEQICQRMLNRPASTRNIVCENYMGPQSEKTLIKHNCCSFEDQQPQKVLELNSIQVILVAQIRACSTETIHYVHQKMVILYEKTTSRTIFIQPTDEHNRTKIVYHTYDPRTFNRRANLECLQNELKGYLESLLSAVFV